MRYKDVHHQITPRDILLLQKLLECQALTTPQIQDAIFESISRSKCVTRLKFLSDISAVGRIEQRTLLSEGKKPYIYIPTAQTVHVVADATGARPEEIRERYGFRKKPLTGDGLFLPHILATADVNIAISRAAVKRNIVFERWENELILKPRHMSDSFTIDGPDGKPEKAAIVPDAFFILDDGGYPYRFFAEVDKHTEVRQSQVTGYRDIARKFQCYRTYFDASKGTPSLYEKTYGTDKGRVLFIAFTHKRVLSLKALCEESGGTSRYWFAVMSDLLAADPLYDAIWRRAGKSDEERFPLLRSNAPLDIARRSDAQ